MYSRLRYLLALPVLFASERPALADLELRFDSSSYIVAASGGTVEVTMLLSDPDGLQGLNDFGLLQAGARIRQTGGAATLAFTAADIVTDFFDATDPNFLTFPDPGSFPAAAEPDSVAGFTGEIPITATAITGNPIEIGRFTLTVTGNPDDTATIVAADINPAPVANEFIIDDAFSTGIDGELTTFGTATITIAPVPEPGAMGLIALGLFSPLLQRRRRG